MGVDLQYGSSYGYLGQFSYISELSWKYVFQDSILNYERGYVVFNKLVSLISDNQQFFLAACAVATMGPMIYNIYRKSYSPVLSVIIFMGLPTFLLQYSGIRQSIALGIGFLSFSFIEEKAFWKFLLSTLLATTFHSVAWLFLVAYPIYHFPMKRSWRILTCFIPPMFYLFRYPLFKLFSGILRENVVIDNNNVITLFVVFYLVYVFCCIFSGEQKDTAGYKNIFLAACCIQGLGGVNALVIRVGYYFMNSLILLLPMITGRMKNRQNARILNITIGICFMLFGIYLIYTTSWSEAYPYRWFWENSI
jgi:hypothetical protein